MDRITPTTKCQFFILLFVLSVTLLVFASTIFAQYDQPTSTPVAIDVVEYAMTFPNFLICNERDFEISEIGWEGVIIGMSRTNELFEVIAEIGEDYSIRASNIGNQIEYTLLLSGIDRTSLRRAPNAVRFCSIDDFIYALAVQYPVTSDLYINDLIAQYSLPQAPSYVIGSAATRVVFWFEYGVATVVTVLDDSFGQISEVIYFPPVQSDAFTEIWPYAYSVSGQNSTISSEELENLYGIQNPFDFDAMIATITAEPSRTPTPTFTPRATVTATATP